MSHLPSLQHSLGNGTASFSHTWDVMYMFGGPGDHVHVCILPTMLYLLQNGQSLSTRKSHHDAFVERLIHVPGIDGNIKVVSYVCIVIYLPCLSNPYALQDGCTLLYYAARGGRTTCVEHFLSSPGFDVDTAFEELFSY